MSEEKNVLEEVVSAIQKLLGFGETEQITATVNQIVDAKGEEAGIVSALQGLFGDAIGHADLLAVVKDFLGQGKGLDLGNVVNLFQGVGDKVGGFDKVAGLMGLAAHAGAAGKITDAVKSVTGVVSGAADTAADTAAHAVGSVTGVVAEAAGTASDTAAGTVSAVTDTVRGASAPATDAAGNAVEDIMQTTVEPAVKAKKKKKWPIVAAVAAAVIVLAGIGMFIWHEQPSFCAAFCHAPMDAYLDTYSQQDNTAGTDKYGNAVANTHAMLAPFHRDQGVTCLACHVPSLTQQMNEGVLFATGNYTVIERTDGNGTAQEERTIAELQDHAGQPNESGKGDEFCLRSGCHEMERADLVTAVKIEGSMRQPHLWLNTPHASAGNMEFACSDCHKSHRASVNACTQCHADAVSPEGWITYQESQSVFKAAA